MVVSFVLSLPLTTANTSIEMAAIKRNYSKTKIGKV